MSDPKEQAKAAKKAAKAQAKREKKRANAVHVTAGSPVQSRGADGGTPAERAAAAAERQVRLQSLRVAVAILMALIAAATFIITQKPWQTSGGPAAESRSPEAPSDQ